MLNWPSFGDSMDFMLFFSFICCFLFGIIEALDFTVSQLNYTVIIDVFNLKLIHKLDFNCVVLINTNTVCTVADVLFDCYSFTVSFFSFFLHFSLLFFSCYILAIIMSLILLFYCIMISIHQILCYISSPSSSPSSLQLLLLFFFLALLLLLQLQCGLLLYIFLLLFGLCMLRIFRSPIHVEWKT